MKLERNYFRGTSDKPFHLSVGAVVVDETGKVACHYFQELGGLKNFYILMRESLELGESIEEGLDRGLLEELGIKANLITYIGSVTSSFEREKDKKIQKTTLYFLFKLSEFKKEWRKPDDEEKDSEIQWHNTEYLISKMDEQAKRLNMSDLDESEVLRRVDLLRSKGLLKK